MRNLRLAVLFSCIGSALAIILAGAGLLFLVLAASAIGSPPGSSSTETATAGAPFVTAYGNTIKQVEYRLTAESIGVTSDGGYIALGLTDSPAGITANWLL